MIDQFYAAYDCFPNYEIEIETGVQINETTFSSEIHQGDIYTVKIKIHRKNKKNGFIHSKQFPFLKKETLFLFIREEKSDNLVYFTRIVSDLDVIEEKFTHYVSSDNSIEFKVDVKSDSYIGFDQSSSFEISFLPRRVVEEFKIHPDDEKALNEETTFK